MKLCAVVPTDEFERMYLVKSKQTEPQKKITVTAAKPSKPAGEGMGMSRIGNLGKFAHKPKK